MTQSRRDEKRERPPAPQSHNVSRRGFLRGAAGGWLGASAFPLLAQMRDSSPLKITRVEPYLVRIGDRASYPLARVETADGLYGWGEGTTPPSSPAVLTDRSSPIAACPMKRKPTLPHHNRPPLSLFFAKIRLRLIIS